MELPQLSPDSLPQLRLLTRLSPSRRKLMAALRLRLSAARVLTSLILFVFASAATPGQTATPAAEGWVVLAMDDYRALRRAAFPAEAEPKTPPVEATLTRLEYELKVDGDFAAGEARLFVDVIKDGWVRLAIPEGLMIQAAVLDGRQINLVTRSGDKEGRGYDLLLSKPGRTTLTLKIVAPISSVAGTEVLKLPVNSAVSRATIELPRRDVDVRVTGGLLLEQSDITSGSRWVANGSGVEPLAFSWRRRVDDQRSTQMLRLRGSIVELVGLGEDLTQISAEVQLQVLQGQARNIKVGLPEQFTVNQVSGATVADWDAAPRELTVTFIDPVQTTARFTLSGEIRLPRDGRLEVPLLRLPTAERESGGVAVEVLGAGEIKERQSTGLDEADAGALDQLIASRQSPSLVAFRFKPAEGKSDRDLSVNVARYTPQAVLTANVDEAEYKVLLAADGKMLVQSRFSVRNNQRNFLKLNLPSTAVLWSASVAGRPLRPGRAPDGSLLLPLEKMKSGEESSAFVVEISYLDRTQAMSNKGRMRLSLLTVDLAISKSKLLLHHPPLFRITPVSGPTATFRPAPYQEPVWAVTRGAAISADAEPKPDAAPMADGNDPTQQLVARLRDVKHLSTPARNRPLRVVFPHFGPSIFLVSELTSENQTPAFELDFRQEKK